MLNQLLTEYFKDPELKQIFHDVLGINDIQAVQSEMVQAISKYLFSSVDAVRFIKSSIGVVFGFVLANGQPVVLKVYSPKFSKEYLQEINRIQDIFFTEKFPAPAVISPIFAFGHTHAGFYQLIEGNSADPHQENIRQELAKYLAEFVGIVEKYNLAPIENFFQQANRGRLWPISHNNLFDLEKNTDGAEWIAEKARHAKKILATDKSKKLLAHTDWGIKNAIFLQSRLVGIFDWDSLGAMTELEMVGRAAAQFTADWESGLIVTPTPEEGRLFVEEYQDYRHKKFTPEEYKIISASADYLIAIISRFEHAGPNPEIHPYQDLLKACGKNSFLFNVS